MKKLGWVEGLGCLLLFCCAVTFSCSSSNAGGEVTLESLKAEVETLQALAPIKLEGVSDLSGEWTITEVPEDNLLATISGTFQITDTVNQTFTITNCPQCPMQAISCTSGSVGFGPSTGGQGTISFTCSGTTRNLFVMSSRRSNIALMSVGKGVTVILSKEDSVVDF